MNRNGHIFLGQGNVIDTRLVDGKYRKHLCIAIIDLSDVAVFGLPHDLLENYLENSSNTLEEFNKIIEKVGVCNPHQDVFAVSISDFAAPRCFKLFGENEFIVVTTDDSDCIRFSILNACNVEFYRKTKDGNPQVVSLVPTAEGCAP